MSDILYLIDEDGKRLKTHFKLLLLSIVKRVMSRILIKLLWNPPPLPFFPNIPGKIKTWLVIFRNTNRMTIKKVADFSGIYWVTSYYTAGSMAADRASI